MPKIFEIQSSSNDKYKFLLSLTTAKGLKKEGLFLLSGRHLVEEFLVSPFKNLLQAEVISSKSYPLSKADMVYQLSPELFNEVDVLGTGYSILVLKQPEIETYKSTKPEGLEIVLPLGDPSNLGAILRSCEAFAVNKVILSSEASHPFLPKAVKASSGSVYRLPLYRGPNLKNFSFDLVGLEKEGKDISTYKWPKNIRLVVGEEGPGLNGVELEEKIKIPIAGVESLNATVAASIALYSYRQTYK